ncbi:MAG: DUF2742 domain-containing protein [Actinomycetota bacterium]
MLDRVAAARPSRSQNALYRKACRRRPVIYSQEVNWYLVHLFVEPTLKNVDSWPTAGTVEWHELPDSDPRKIAAVLDAARHWALRLDSCQDDLVDAGEQIAEAAPWSQIANAKRNRDTWEQTHPWARRAAS